VRYGYMRGGETVDYVRRIRDRWAEYRGVAKGGSHGFFTAPERARRNYRWHL
jgi:membrane-bound lytic murein transglycosylase F